jgi:putative ABC transport system permease protein
MDYRELFFQSLSALSLNKVRTALAMLGVIIGIGSVIALLSLGQSSQLSIEQQIKSLGSNLITVMPSFSQRGGIKSASSTDTLTYDDAKAIASTSQITNVKNVAVELSQNSQITASGNNTNVQVSGTSPEYATIRNLSLQSGSYFNQNQVIGMSPVAVLGPQTATDLFGNPASALGKSIRIEGISFTIIGITESKGGSGMNNFDDKAYVPITTAQKRLFGTNSVSSIYIEAESEEDMAKTQIEVGYFLLAQHKLTDPASADFQIMSQEDLLGTIGEVTGTFTALLSGIAAISLIVGGIGIMNIMLVTVTERTREIGLRKALGAKKHYIVQQFLLEAVLVTFIGGLIGILVGIGTSFILTKTMNLPFTLSAPSLFLAFVVSAIIGIIFGWYPAQKAAKLQPIEALRYE